MIYSIHVGCDDIDETAYPPNPPNGWKLPQSVASAKSMQAFVLKKFPHANTQLLVDRTTVADVQAALARVAPLAVADDLVIFTYAGHGALLTTSFPAAIGLPPSAISAGDITGRNFEVTILLWDRMMIANEFGRALTAFKPGVRFFNIIDGCGLGTFYFLTLGARLSRILTTPFRKRGKPVSMSVDPVLMKALYDRNPALYDSLAPDPGPLPVIGINFGSCKDGETSFQDNVDSYFTGSVDRVLRRASPPADYTALAAAVEKELLKLTSAAHCPPMHPTILPFGAATASDLARPPFT